MSALHHGHSEHRSINEIAQDIIDAAPQVEPLIEEFFALITDRYRPVFRCRFCGQGAPDEWGADRRCPEYPKPDRPAYMQSCEIARVH